MLRFSGDENHLFFEIGERLLISPQADRKFPGLRAGSSEGSAEIGDVAAGRICGRRSNAWLSLPMSGLERFACRCCPVSSRFIRPCRKRVKARKRFPAEYSGPQTEMASTRNTCLIFSVQSSEENVSFHFRDGQSAGEMRPAGGDGSGPVPLRDYADAHLMKGRIACRRQIDSGYLWQVKMWQQ